MKQDAIKVICASVMVGILWFMLPVSAQKVPTPVKPATKPVAKSLQNATRPKISAVEDPAVSTATHGAELVVQSGHAAPIEGVAYSPNGDIIATESRDNSVLLWDSINGLQLRRVPRLQWRGFSPDGRYALIREGDFTVTRDLLTWAEVKRERGEATGSAVVAKGKIGGKSVRFETSQRDVRQIDAATNQVTRLYDGKARRIRRTLTTPDGKLWIIADADGADTGGVARLWDVVGQREVARIDGLETSADGNPLALLLSPDGSLLATGQTNGTVQLWNTARGELVETLSGHTSGILSLAFSSDGKRLASGSKDRTIRIWSLTTGRELIKIVEPPDLEEKLRARKAAAIAAALQAALQAEADAKTATEATTAPTEPATEQKSPTTTEAKVKEATTTEAKNTASAAGLYSDVGRVGPASALAFSPDGQWLVTAFEDGTRALWQTDSGDETRRWTETVAGASQQMVFSSSGNTLLSGDSDGVARLWNVASGTSAREFRGHGGAVQSVAFSPDGREVLTASVDGTSRVWNADSGSELHHFEAFGWMWSATYFANGRFVLTASDDGILRVWRTADRRPVAGLILFSNGNWAAVDSLGRYDTGQGARSRDLHWANKGRTQDLDDFRQPYYTKNLLVRALRLDPLDPAEAPLSETPTDIPTGMRQAGAHFFPNGPTGRASGFTADAGRDDGALSLSKIRLMAHLGHARNVTLTRVSGDGKYLLTSGQDGTAILWDPEMGREICRFFYGRPSAANFGALTAVDFAAEGRALTITAHNTTHYWDLLQRREISLPGLNDAVGTVLIARDARFAMHLSGGQARLLHIGNGENPREEWKRKADCAAFSPDGQNVVLGEGNAATIYRVDKPEVAGHLGGSVAAPRLLSTAPDGRFILLGYLSANEEHRAHLWDTETGRSVANLRIATPNSKAGKAGGAPAFSPDGRTLLVQEGREDKASLYDCTSGQVLQSWPRIAKAFFSPDGKQILLCGTDGKAKLCDVANGRERVSFALPVPEQIEMAEGNRFALLRNATGWHLWNIENGRELPQPNLQTPLAVNGIFSRNGNLLFIAYANGTARLWDVEEARDLWTLPAQPSALRVTMFSPDGKQLATGDAANNVCLWNVADGTLLHSCEMPIEHQNMNGLTLKSVDFSASGHTLRACTTGTPFTYFWQTETGDLTYFANGESRFLPADETALGRVLSDDVALTSKPVRLVNVTRGVVIQEISKAGDESPSAPPFYGNRQETCRGGRYLLLAQDDRVGVWSVAAEQMVAQLFAFRDDTWAMVDAQARYDDGVEGEIPHLHWVLGTADIELKQLKDSFYEPGLLAKKLGTSAEPLRAVTPVNDLRPAPRVLMEVPPADGRDLKIELHNQGGGIGPVHVFLNDKEIVEDARATQKLDSRLLLRQAQQSRMSLMVNLADRRVQEGQVNKLRVVADNIDGTVSSRAREADWRVEGPDSRPPAQLFAVIAGVSDYAPASGIPSLSYPAKDARDMLVGLHLGAQNLFAGREHYVLLTGENEPAPVPLLDGAEVKRLPATKENFRQTFEDIIKNSKPQDVLLIYLAGHGAPIGQGNSSYCYLMQDSKNTNVNAPESREWTISSVELHNWANQMPAQKQVLILDTCAAGAATDDLTRSRAADGDQIRAMQRLKDGTGLLILMGAAANRESYEAGRYRQGLLTYALLEGLRGSGLNDGKFVDVYQWFEYAQKRVPELARNIGGIQKPLFAERKSLSFPLGIIKPEDKERVPLSTPQPQVLRPRLGDVAEGGLFDTLDITPQLRQALKIQSSESERNEQGMVYVDSAELPGALVPKGQYEVKGARIEVQFSLWRDGEKKIGPEGDSGPMDKLPELIERLAKLIRLRAIEIGPVKDATPITALSVAPPRKQVNK